LVSLRLNWFEREGEALRAQWVAGASTGFKSKKPAFAESAVWKINVISFHGNFSEKAGRLIFT
jgi:hypothetical protein